MALTDAQKRYAYYVLATVETHCNYGGTNQYDAITLGIVQWYGQNAWRLMDKVRSEAPDAYERLSQRLRTLTEGGAQSWNYWTGIYLLDDDASSWASSAELDSNKACQDNLFMEDAFGSGGRYDQLKSWGLDDDPKRAIFYMVMQWQRPASASSMMASVGNASLDTLLQWALSDSIMGQYKNRYNDTYNMLTSWDGTSEPPDFGMVAGDTSGDPSGSIESGSLQSTLAYVQEWGNNLVAFGKMSTTDRLLLYNTGKGIWVPVDGTVPDNPASGSPGGTMAPASPDDPADFPAMRQLWYDNENAWSYGQGAGRLNPPQSGYSDCSACIYWAANAATNNKYSWMGTYTEAMKNNCPHVWEGNGTIPIDQLRPGDIILFDYGGDGPTDHAEWYMGGGVVWGSGRAPLPHFTTDDVVNINQIFGAANMIVVRFLD